MVGAGPLRILRGIGRALGTGDGARQEPGPSVSKQESAATTPGASAALRIEGGCGLGLRPMSGLLCAAPVSK